MYISANRDDKIGLELESGEYYRAMEMLFTTQVSDTVHLTKEKDIKNIFSAERNFVMNRKTAIDWKLFKRALNFIFRATEELEMTEGNALLYRGAGDLEKNGRMNMNYGFLRKNFHRTGNQWTRAMLNFGGKAALVNVDKKDTSGKVLKILAKDVKDVEKIVGFDKEGYVHNSINNLSEYSKMAKDKKEEVLGQKNAEIKAYKNIQKKNDKIVKEGKTAKQIMKEVKAFLDDTLMQDLESIEGEIFTQEKSASPDMENVVEKTTEGMKKDKKHGDFRDDVNDAKANVKKVKKIKKTVKTLSKTLGVTQLYNLIDLVEYSVEKTAYKFLDDKVFGLNAEQRGKELS